jgi:hypothetical protein
MSKNNSENLTGDIPDKYKPDTSYQDKMCESIQQAATSKGEPLTRTEYNKWREETTETHVSASTIVRDIHHGSWETACKNAGVTPGNDSH